MRHSLGYLLGFAPSEMVEKRIINCEDIFEMFLLEKPIGVCGKEDVWNHPTSYFWLNQTSKLKETIRI
jgi:hypothetical protein